MPYHPRAPGTTVPDSLNIPRMLRPSLRTVLWFLLLTFGFTGLVHAQSEEDTRSGSSPTAADSAGWTYDATARLNLSQAAYKDWQEGGGVNSLAVSAATGGVAREREGHWFQTHELRLALGIIDQQDRALRKSEDQIRYQSTLRYEGDDFFRVLNPTVALQLRTQFAAGFDYNGNPFEGEVPMGDPRLERTTPVQTSSFFAPAFITESLGLTYKPASQLTMRFGAASKQTVVVEEDFRVLYGVQSDRTVRIEAGGEFASTLDTQLSDNIRYRSDLGVFYAINQLEEPPDVLWENTITLEVNDWLSTNLEFTALYDQQITNAIQLRETISVGLSFTLL